MSWIQILTYLCGAILPAKAGLPLSGLQPSPRAPGFPTFQFIERLLSYRCNEMNGMLLIIPELRRRHGRTGDRRRFEQFIE